MNDFLDIIQRPIFLKPRFGHWTVELGPIDRVIPYLQMKTGTSSIDWPNFLRPEMGTNSINRAQFSRFYT
jgi:hypothetical protein